MVTDAASSTLLALTADPSVLADVGSSTLLARTLHALRFRPSERGRKRARERAQHNSAKLKKSGTQTKRTQATLEDGNAPNHGVGEKKMRMMLQSNYD